MSTLPGSNFGDQLKFLSFKYSTKKIDNKWHSSYGLLYIGQIEFGAGFIFSSFTKGDNNNNISISPGLAYVKNDLELIFAENITLVFSAKKRVGNSLSLISENWTFINEDSVLIMSNSGFRFFGRRLSVDFSWPFFFSTEGSGVGFPLFTFSYKF